MRPTRMSAPALAVIAAALVIAAIVVAPTMVRATGGPVLVSSSPGASTSVAEPPPRIEMVFTGAVRPGSVDVVLLDADRRETIVPAPTLSRDGGVVTVSPLPPIADGTWVVTWSVELVDRDGVHEGSFAFQVGDGDGRNHRQPGQLVGTLRTDSGLGWALGALRVLALLGGLVLMGGVLVVRDPVRAASPRATTVRMFALLALVIGSAGVLLLWGAHAAGLSWGAIGDTALLRDTLTERVGVAALGCVVLAVGWLVVVGTTRVEPPRWWTPATRVLAVATLVSVAAGGPLPGVGDGADGRDSFRASLVAGDTVAELEVLPAAAGTAEVHVYLSPPGGMLAPAESVTMTMAGPGLGLAAMPVALVEAGPNHWSGVVLIPYAGEWLLDIVSTTADGTTSRFAATAPVTE
jgi:methionine-rich copper-binding protein CopC